MKFGNLTIGDRFLFVYPSGQRSGVNQKVDNQATNFDNSGVFRMLDPNASKWNYISHNDAEVIRQD